MEQQQHCLPTYGTSILLRIALRKNNTGRTSIEVYLVWSMADLTIHKILGSPEKVRTKKVVGRRSSTKERVVLSDESNSSLWSMTGSIGSCLGVPILVRGEQFDSEGLMAY